MKAFTCVAISVLCLAASLDAQKDPLTVQDCGKAPRSNKSGDRIVGGEYATHGQYPWMLSLWELDGGWYHACGATIINERWIVTAAHCIDFKYSPWRYKIYAGLHKQSQKYDSAVKVYAIDEIHMHEKYDAETNSNDIALMRTEEDIDIKGSKGYINGVCLPRDNTDPTGTVTVAGWGHEWSNGRMSDTLKHLQTPMVDRRICNRAYTRSGQPDAILSNMICAGQKGEDSCQSDSGGPLIKTNNGVSTLVGITSFGAGCGLDGYPGVYAKVGYFRSWIEKTIQKRDPKYRA